MVNIDLSSVLQERLKVKRADVIRLIKSASRDRRLVFTGHALDEMDVEGETQESVARALHTAKSFTLQDNGRWRVHGDELTVIVQMEDSTVFVWTVFTG